MKRALPIVLIALALGLASFLWVFSPDRVETTAETAIGPAEEDTSPMVGVDSTEAREVVAETATERAEPEEPAEEVSDTAEPPLRNPTVTLTGAAIRVDEEGGEHTADDGTLTLYAHYDGIHPKHKVVVTGGQFSLVVPVHATLSVYELVLAEHPIRIEAPEFPVPANYFLILRGDELQDVLLHVVDAETNEELKGVDLFLSGNSQFSSGLQHPGKNPEGAAHVNNAASPVLVPPTGGGRWTSRSYWVSAPDHAWAVVALDHAGGGERTLALKPQAALEVVLIGLEDWLQPKVRLWLPDASRRAHAFAEREPDADGSAQFEGLPVGTYDVSVERGWGNSRISFGEQRITLRHRRGATMLLHLDLPECPEEVVVSGRLVLPRSWSRTGIALNFVAQGEAAVWSEEAPTVSLDAMQPAQSDDDSAEAFAWNITLPVSGNYELTVAPLMIRRLLEVPVGGLTDVEIVVPGAADVEVRVVDDSTEEEITVERLYWSPPQVEGITMTPLFTVARDEAKGRVTFRTPAGGIGIQPVDQSLKMIDERAVHEVAPGPNLITVRVHRQIGVRFHLMDNETELPWSWDWQLGANQVDGKARDVARSIGKLWFREPGVYELGSANGVPGYEAIDGFHFEVRQLALGETELDVRVTLRRKDS